MSSTYAPGLQLTGRRLAYYHHRAEDIRIAGSGSSKRHKRKRLPPAVHDDDYDDDYYYDDDDGGGDLGMVGPPPRGFDPITLTVVSSTADVDADNDAATGSPSEEDSSSECNTAHREPVARIYGVDYARLRELQVEPVAKQTALQETVIPQRVLDSNGGFLPTTTTTSVPTTPLPASIVPAGESTRLSSKDSSGTQVVAASAAAAAVAATTPTAATATFYDSSISESTGPPAMTHPCPSTTDFAYSAYKMDPKSIPLICGYCHGYVKRCACPMLQNSGRFIEDLKEHDTWYAGKEGY
jgi:hypothetical protein